MGNKTHYMQVFRVSAGAIVASGALAASVAFAGGVDPNYRSTYEGAPRATTSTGSAAKPSTSGANMDTGLGYNDVYRSVELPEVTDLRDMSLEELDAYIHELDYLSYSSALTLDEMVPLSEEMQKEARRKIEPPEVYKVPKSAITMPIPIKAPKVSPNEASKLLNDLPEMTDIPLPSIDPALQSGKVAAKDGTDYGVAINSEELNDRLQQWADGVTANSLPTKEEQPLVVERKIDIMHDDTEPMRESENLSMDIYTEAERQERAERVEYNDPTADEPIDNDDVELDVSVRKNANQLLTDLGQAYNSLKVGQYESAIALYKRVLREKPDHPDALFGLATAYHRSDQLEQAQALYLRLLEQDNKHEGAVNNLLLIVSQKSPSVAIDQLQIMARANPEYAAIPAQLAMILMRAGDYDNAAKYMLRAARLEPANLSYRYYMGMLLEELGDYAQAVEVYRGIIRYHQREKVPLPDTFMMIERRIENAQTMQRVVAER